MPRGPSIAQECFSRSCAQSTTSSEALVKYLALNCPAGDSSSIYFFFAAAFLIRALALIASASFSKPITAEYFLPITCATRKSILTPASATACAMPCPKPDRIQLHHCFGVIPRIAVPHDDLQVRSNFGQGFQRPGQGSCLVLEFFPPQGDTFHCHCHDCSSR